eukprot:jgi/Botrbrau1/19601/Bobra.0035s0079.1
MGWRPHAIAVAVVPLWICALSVVGGLRDIPGGASTTGVGRIVPPDSYAHKFLIAFGKSFLMILVTEFGDETFIIAAIMAMRHPRLVVYVGAMSALVFMTVISTALGYVLPNLISRRATHHAATLLYTIFGLRLLWIAWKSPADESNQEEVEEVQQKLAEAEQTANHGRLWRLFASICTPVLVEALLLTFIAEWGDRSQIATITLAAVYNPYGVTLGAIAGHMLCTGTAVLGGQLLAMRISQRTVAIAGAALFLIFALNSLISKPEL